METEQYLQIKRSVKSVLRIDLDHYKDEQMRRRLDSWLVRSGAPDWPEYFKRINADSLELARFRDYLTINVSGFFRDLERWQALEKDVLPRLLAENRRAAFEQRRVNVWSAGCSTGPEPYTLAMMFNELFGRFSYHILATDLDRGALAKAKMGGPYTTEEIQSLGEHLRTAYLRPAGPPYFLKPGLGNKIEFREHNLISDPIPATFDLIVCRNVVIYFKNETKENLYRKFYAALRPGGVLFVGATEIISYPQQIGFENFGISFYRKPGL